MNSIEIANILNLSVNISKIDILWLLTDSRLLTFPSQTLFFALKTERNDGHKYIKELYEKGVKCFVISDYNEEFDIMSDALFFRVPNVLNALQKIAIAKRSKYPELEVIGITGSNGKTIVKEWLYQLLNDDYSIVRSPRSYNSQIGVPLSVWMINNSTELGIFEAGISLPNEMQNLQPIINPTIGIFTHLGDAHQSGFDSLEKKLEEKVLLFKNSKTIIYSADNPLVDNVMHQKFEEEKLFSWGKSSNNKLQIVSIKQEETITYIELKYQQIQSKFILPFTDKASVENLLHTVSLLLKIGYSLKEINDKISRLKPVEMRLEVKEGVNNSILIDDTYNMDYDSLEIAIQYQHNKLVGSQLSRTIILSDIPQSAYIHQDLYKKVVQLIHSKKIDKIIGIGTIISSYSHLFEKTKCKSYFYLTTQEFLNSIDDKDFSNQLILLKGAREFRFEKIVQRLQKRVHQTTLDVNLNALIHNFNTFRGQLKPTTKIMCMVKAFGYGSGSIEVARALQQHNCNYLAVAVADEGAELRKAGITIPIVVMNPEQKSFDILISNRLEPEIYNFEILNSFLEYTRTMGINDYPIHLKFDTGMHRLGFEQKDIENLINILKNQNQIKIETLFSHLSGADNREFDDFTHTQINNFTTFAEQLTREFSYPILKHILNSAGIERFTDYQFDMVRLGIGLYGVSAVDNSLLNTVCTLKTIILQTKTIKSGETVGYSRNGKVNKESIIGIIPVGYADGFDRRLGNGVGEVMVNGKRAKTIGNVCMDLTLIDITDIDAKVGDVVEVFGKNISITEVAQKINTIPYEILTSVSQRVKRVYFID